MDRLEQLFSNRKGAILSVYFTAGYPKADSTGSIIKSLANAGADLIEIGIPFSDPMADGPTIQESNSVAIQNGMSVSLLFRQLRNVRLHTQMPILLMGYLNPILQYGLEQFCKDAVSCGIDGLIIPDIPPDEYEGTYRKAFDAHNIKLILLITPRTTEERIRRIDRLSAGFIYLVTSSSVTGNTSGYNPVQIDYLRRVREMGLINPVLAGFGIATADQFRTVCSYVQGAIIGSRFIEVLKHNEAHPEEAINLFISGIREQP